MRPMNSRIPAISKSTDMFPYCIKAAEKLLTLERHYFLFFGLGIAFSLGTSGVHGVFDLLFEALGVVFTDLFVFFGFTNNIHGVVAHTAHANHSLFEAFTDLLG